MSQNCTPDQPLSGVVDLLDEAAARFQMAARFYEGACLDQPDLVNFYRDLLVRYADNLAAVARGASHAAA